MNSKLMKAGIAGAAVVALAAGGSTFAAYSDFGNINSNSIGAGILKLNLTSGSGGADTPLTFGNLAPGMATAQAIYVASSDGNSVPPADLKLTISNVKDYENGCGSSQSEAAVDPDCLTANALSADPAQVAADDGTKGDLSKILGLRVVSYSAPSALVCKGYVGATGDPGPVINNSVLTNEMGVLADPTQVGQPKLISDPAAPLTHGQGVCLVLTSYWNNPRTGTVYPGAPVDNAAQSDSLTFDAHFDLIQH